MVLHLHHIFYPQRNSLKSPFLSTFKKRRNNNNNRNNSSCIVCGFEESESDFEVDQDKAREALRQLDEQLQSLSKKQLNSPKIRVAASDLNRVEEEPRMREEPPEISGSFLTSSAIVLVLLTIFYNILFLTVIKPAIDGPEQPTSSVPEAQEAAPFRRITLMPYS